MDDDYPEREMLDQSMIERIEKVESDLAHITEMVYALAERFTDLRSNYEQHHAVYGGTYSR